MNTNITLSSKFYNGLKKHELSKDLLISQGWGYSGGRTYSEKKPNRHSRYFNIVYGNNAIKPDFINHCICGNRLYTDNCYITNRSKKKTLALGSCCIKKFVTKKNRTCLNCEEDHRNKKDNLCHDCRKKYKTCLCCNAVIKKQYNYCYKCNMKDIEELNKEFHISLINKNKN